MRRGEPSTIALTRLIFGFQARLERLWEWETLMPNVTPFPQIAHFAIESAPPFTLCNKLTLLFYQIFKEIASTTFIFLIFLCVHSARKYLLQPGYKW
jgi:hypothetical protein